MKLNIDVTPLYGAQSDDHAISTLLSIEGFNILLDCGWNSLFDPSFLKNLADVAPKVHAVLLSHSDISHLGALPYASSKLGLKAPIFSTLPVWRMGQMFMYDAYLAQDAEESFTLFDLDDVDATFDYFAANETKTNHFDDNPNTNNTSNNDETNNAKNKIVKKKSRFTLLKYQQSYALNDIINDSEQDGEQDSVIDEHLKNIIKDLVIVPHRAGHMIGGTVWNIVKDTVNIVYAVHINHRKERHLSPTTLVKFSRPSHLILSSLNSLTKSNKLIGEEVLIKTIKTKPPLSNILVPVDTAGRLIELAVQLDNLWENDNQLKDKKNIFILHPLSIRTFDFAKSMIEWSSDEFMTSFDVTRKNMFQFKHVQLVPDLATLDSLMLSSNNQSNIVLATSPSLQSGPSKSLFIQWANNPKNTVVLVNKPEPNTIYSKLYSHVQSMQDKNENSSSDGLEMEVKIGKKVPLQGEELNEWREKEKVRKQIEAEQLRIEEEEKLRKEEEEKENERKRKLEEELLANSENGMLARNLTAVDGDQLMINENLNDEQQKFDGLHENKIINKEAKEKEFEESILSHLRDLGVIPKKRCEIFEYNNGTMENDMLVEWDEYGQKIDTSRFIIGEDPGDGVKYILEDELLRSKTKKVEEKQKEEEIIPTKYISDVVKIQVKCDIIIADCSGLSDGDSIRHLVKEIEPRHVTIIGGNEKESSHLGQILKKALSITTGNIVMPNIMETIHMISNINVYNISLDDHLVKSVNWKKIGLANIGFVKGEINDHFDSKGLNILGLNDHNRSSQNLISFEDEDIDCDDNDMEIENVNISEENEKSFGTYFVGTVLLNKLKDQIADAGLKAEFAGGALCVENPKTGAVVLVKKVGGQHISLQGSLCEEYFTIQDLLYKQVVIPR